MLSRFALLDDVPGNGESWFLARAFEQLRRLLPEIRGVISYSDPVPRELAGRLVKPGHVGIIYQAHNGHYRGRSRPETLHLAPDGSVFDRRSQGKLRLDERGAERVYERLLGLGAPRRLPLEGGPAYVARALREGPFRRLRHPGNHVYCWGLDRASRRNLGPSAPYPKQRDS